MSFALSVIAKASIILIGASLLSLLLRRASASTRHAVWVLATLSAVLLPVVSAVVPQMQLPVLPEGSVNVRFLPLTAQTAVVSDADRGLKPSTTHSVARVVPVLWVLGLAFLLLRVLGGTLAVRRLAKSASGTEDGTWREFITQLSDALSIRKPVRLLFGGEHVSPMTWGVWRHTILMPSSAGDWSVERRRLVLAHELAHVKRNDGIFQIFLQIVCSIYWFNPLIWYAAHRVRIERERACDDQVLNLGAAAEDYADHLVQIVRGLRGRRSSSFATVSMAQPSQLETRLVSILDSQTRRRTVSRVAVTCLCALMALLTISIASIGVTAAVPLPPVLVVATRLIPPPPEAKPAPAAPQRTHIGNAGTAPYSAVTPPQVIDSSAPLYTDEARAARIEGTVTLEASVDIQGNVTILRTVKGLGYGLDERAIASVLNWRLAPALRDGTPVQAVTQIDVEFKLPPEAPFKVGAGVMPPKIVFRVEPQYSDEARNAHYQGTVSLQVIVRKDGSVDIQRVIHSVGLGLDQSAIDALKQWRFNPGTRNGEPVDVSLNVEVNFNLK